MTFLSQRGTSFDSVSYLSGLDAIADGRAFAKSDLDHDGDVDIILLNRTEPLLTILENQSSQKHNWIALKLHGDGKKTNRDAVGSIVTVECGTTRVVRLNDMGSGFSAQNSSVMTIGLGNCPSVAHIQVKWPNGETQQFPNLEIKQLYHLTHGEDAAKIATYQHEPPLDACRIVPRRQLLFPELLKGVLSGEQYGGPKVKQTSENDFVFISFWASWCESSKRAQPRLDALWRKYKERIDFIGVSLELEDTPEKVLAYHREHKPAYAFAGLPADVHKLVDELARRALGRKSLSFPSTLILCRKTGKILLRQIGSAPSVSQLEQMLIAADCGPPKN